MITGEVCSSYFGVLAFSANVSSVGEDKNFTFNSELHMASQQYLLYKRKCELLRDPPSLYFFYEYIYYSVLSWLVSVTVK